VPGVIRLLRSGDGASGRSLGAAEAERPELVVDDVGADPAVGSFDPFLDLG